MNHPKGSVNVGGASKPRPSPTSPLRNDQPKTSKHPQRRGMARPPARAEDPDGPTTSEGEVVVAAGTGVPLQAIDMMRDGRG